MTNIKEISFLYNNSREDLESHLNLNPKIDSLRIYIPEGEYEIIDSYFGELCTITNVYTGETQDVTEALRKTEYRDRTHPNIRTTFSLTNQLDFRGREAMEGDSERPMLLCVLINAKQLRSNYLQGITRESIREIYDFLMSLGAVRFSFDSFLNAHVLDIDVCMDFLCPDDVDHDNDVDNLYKGLLNAPNLLQSDLAQRYKTTTLYFNRGRENAQIGKPHIKLYDKTAELLGFRLRELECGEKTDVAVSNNSRSFFDEYLRGKPIEKLVKRGILRIEYTFKNRRFLKAFDLDEVRNLESLLNVEDDVFRSSFVVMFSKYFEGLLKKENKEIEGMASLTPDNLAFCDLIEAYVGFNSGANEEDILKLMTAKIRLYKSKQTLYSKRESYRELIKLNLPSDVKEKIELNNKKDRRKIEVLKSMGLYD